MTAGVAISPRRGVRTRTFPGNPWKLSFREAVCVWLLSEMQIEAIATRLGVSIGTVRSRLSCAYQKMEVGHASAAAVQFDRWWQQYKRDANDEIVRMFEIELLEPAA